ncbi:hypothetical protein B0H14DRAFT_2598563 [Mycena olivaceomarginata]|nr:hypothetical protein B0H14DRAFT_2598563 [Mycena olivaceomarginata]
MAKFTRSRSLRATKRKAVSSPFVDDEARSSEEEGACPGKADNNDVQEEPTDNNEYESAFINDGDPYEGAGHQSASLTPPPRTQQSSKRKHFSEAFGAEANLTASFPIDPQRASSPDPSGTPLARKKTRTQAPKSKAADSGTAGDDDEAARFVSEWKRMNKLYKGKLPALIAAATDGSIALTGKVTRKATNKMVQRPSTVPRCPDWRVPSLLTGRDAVLERPETPKPKDRIGRVKGSAAKKTTSDSDNDDAVTLSANKDRETVKPASTSGITAKGRGVKFKLGCFCCTLLHMRCLISLSTSGELSAHEIVDFKGNPATPAGKKGAQNSKAVDFGLPDEEEISGPTKSQSDEVASTVFLEDIETYRAYFDPDAPCGVSDIDLQDPILQPSYKGLPPLPSVFADFFVLNCSNRQIMPIYDSNRLVGSGEESTKGGRVKYTTWQKWIRDMLVDNSHGAITFQEASPNLINPSRVSPIRLSSRISVGSSTTYRLHVGDRIATCVSAVFYSDDLFNTAAPVDMFSPVKASTSSKIPMKSTSQSNKFSAARAKTLLAYNDRVPVYDARKVVVNFDTDLACLDAVVPPFVGEIPFGSFVVVGYTCSVYHTACCLDLGLEGLKPT